jgi:hypothetical protein
MSNHSDEGCELEVNQDNQVENEGKKIIEKEKIESGRV